MPSERIVTVGGGLGLVAAGAAVPEDVLADPSAAPAPWAAAPP